MIPNASFAKIQWLGRVISLADTLFAQAAFLTTSNRIEYVQAAKSKFRKTSRSKLIISCKVDYMSSFLTITTYTEKILG